MIRIPGRSGRVSSCFSSSRCCVSIQAVRAEVEQARARTIRAERIRAEQELQHVASLKALRAEVEQARVLTIRAEQICAEQELQHAAACAATITLFNDYQYYYVHPPFFSF